MLVYESYGWAVDNKQHTIVEIFHKATKVLPAEK